MKLKSEQLKPQLKKQRFPLYWLAGDDPLLMQEAADSIRAHFRNEDFNERQVFDVDKGFNWDSFSQSTNSLSLFAERKIFDLRLASAKLDDAGKAALQRYIEDPSSDNVVILSSPKLDSSTLNTKWFKSIEAESALVQIWPINAEGLPAWLDQRLRQYGIEASRQAIALLCIKIEGNLLAAMQEIEKLKLLANVDNGETISLDEKTVMQVVADSSRYSVYNLVDSALLGDSKRSLKILQGLKNEGCFPLTILGALSYELRSLLTMTEQVAQGQAIQSVIQTNRVWFNRKQAVATALRRIKPDTIWVLLKRAKVIDQSVKGLLVSNPWDELSLLVLQLCGVNTATMTQNTDLQTT